MHTYMDLRSSVLSHGIYSLGVPIVEAHASLSLYLFLFQCFSFIISFSSSINCVISTLNRGYSLTYKDVILKVFQCALPRGLHSTF